jgi:hypothetical protein
MSVCGGVQVFFILFFGTGCDSGWDQFNASKMDGATTKPPSAATGMAC